MGAVVLEEEFGSRSLLVVPLMLQKENKLTEMMNLCDIGSKLFFANEGVRDHLDMDDTVRTFSVAGISGPEDMSNENMRIKVTDTILSVWLNLHFPSKLYLALKCFENY